MAFGAWVLHHWNMKRRVLLTGWILLSTGLACAGNADVERAGAEPSDARTESTVESNRPAPTDETVADDVGGESDVDVTPVAPVADEGVDVDEAAAEDTDA